MVGNQIVYAPFHSRLRIFLQMHLVLELVDMHGDSYSEVSESGHVFRSKKLNRRTGD